MKLFESNCRKIKPELVSPAYGGDKCTNLSLGLVLVDNNEVAHVFRVVRITMQLRLECNVNLDREYD